MIKFSNFQIILTIFLVLIVTPLFSLVSVKADFSPSPLNSNKINLNEKNWFVYQAKAGETIRDTILLKNKVNQETIVNLESKDSKILEDGLFTILGPDEENKQVGKWVDLDVNKITLSANNSSQVSFEIKIPENTPDGEYSAGISAIESVSNKEKNNNQANIIKRYGLRIYIAVGEKYNLNIQPSQLNILDPGDKNFSQLLTKKPYFGKNNMVLEYEAENLGNIFGIINGKYSLTKPDGSVYENTFSAEIAPSVGKRKYTIITNQKYEIGKTEVVADFKITALNSKIEKYTNLNPKTALGDAVELNNNSWDNFPTRSVAAFKEETKETNQLYSNINSNYFNLEYLVTLVIINLYAGFVFSQKIFKKFLFTLAENNS
jgi:hypothetical protein